MSRGHVAYHSDEAERFARAVLEDLDGAGAFADWLDENDPTPAPYLSGRPSMTRGAMLRRRWKAWQKERESGYDRSMQILHEEHLTRLLYIYSDPEYRDKWKEFADDRFRAYIRARFIPRVRTR